MTQYKKVVTVLVFNDAQELALQLRAAQDDSFPSHWDFSAGGGIDPGESSEVSAARELREELGVEAHVEYVTEKHYTYPAWIPGVTREVDMIVYKAWHSGPFNPAAEEVEKVQFASLETIGEMVKRGMKFHPEFTLLWNDGVIAQAGKS